MIMKLRMALPSRNRKVRLKVNVTGGTYVYMFVGSLQSTDTQDDSNT